MFKKLSAVGIFVALLLTFSNTAYAQGTLEKIEKDAGFITVSKTATKEISPNKAEITVKIETSDTKLKTAVEKNRLIANNVYNSIKSIIKPQNGDFIKTGSYSATPNYNYKDGKKIFDKYIVTNSVTVKVNDTDSISTIVDTAVSKGATDIENIQFSASNYENSCDGLLNNLTKQAYIEANSIAHSANSRVTGIKEISTSCTTDSPQRPVYRMMSAMNSLDEKAAISTPIESGKIKIYATLNASFYVAP